MKDMIQERKTMGMLRYTGWRKEQKATWCPICRNKKYRYSQYCAACTDKIRWAAEEMNEKRKKRNESMA